MADNSNQVQIDKTLLDQLNGTRALLARLMDDPAEGLALKRRIKKIVPDAKFPELDIVETVTKPYDEKIEALTKSQKEMQERMDKEAKERADSAAELSLRERLEAVRKQFGFTDEGMQEVVKRMRDQNSPDVEAAAYYIAGIQPKAAPTVGSGMFPSKMNLWGSAEASDDPKLQALNKDPMHFLETEAIAVLDEFARGEAA